MAKDKITEYDATANNNTVCGDVNIAENSALPSDMNNFAREIMSHLKEGLGSGTPLYVDQTNNRVGINKTPTVALDVSGSLSVDGGTIKLDGNYPTGTSNVALGDTALDSGSLTGNGNTAIGAGVLTSNTSAGNNTGVGNGALYFTTTGGFNTAVGANGLVTNTTGAYNTAIGDSALRLNTTASNNTAVGYQALYSTQDIGNNVAIGYRAGYLFNGDYGYNTIVGYQAGYSLSGTTGGYGNTLIGSSGTTGRGAGYYITTGTLNTIIGGYDGNQGGLDIRTSSNNIVLSDGDGNPRIINDGTKTSIGSPTTSKTSTGTIEIKGTSANQSIITNSDNAVSYANGATLNFNARSGVCIVNNHSTGTVELFVMGGGSVSRFAGSGLTGGSFAYVAPNYVWTNDEGVTYTFTHTYIQTRNTV